MTKNISPNMTPNKLDEIMAALPDNMDEGELCALTLTIHAAYTENPTDIITNLIAAIYSYGMSIGISHDSISEGLRHTADAQDESYRNDVRH